MGLTSKHLVCRKLCHKLYFSRYLSVTSKGPVFAKSFEQRTEDPRVGNTAITAVNMHPEGFDLIGAFYG